MPKPRVPAALNIFNGNPGKRPPRKPVSLKGKPVCPSWLHEYAKAHWKRVCVDLVRHDLVKQVDEGTFALMCQAFAEARIALQDLKANGRIIEVPIQTRSGEIIGYDRKPNPAAKQLQNAIDGYLRYATQFAMTTISRTKIEKVGGDAEDELEAFLEGDRKSG